MPYERIRVKILDRYIMASIAVTFLFSIAMFLGLLLAMDLMKKLVELKGCEMHMTHIPTPGDDVGLKRLGVNLTTDGKSSSHNLLES